MRQIITSLTCLVLAASCVGKAPSGGGGDDGVEPDAGVEVDAPPPDPGQTLSGVTRDYFTPTDAMDNITLISDGVNPPLTTQSAIGGAFTVAGIPTGSIVYFNAIGAVGVYKPTRNPAVTIEGMPVTMDQYVMTAQEIANQYVGTGNTLLNAGNAYVAAELYRNNGTPLANVTIADISLVDALNAPILTAKFYAFGITYVDPALGTPTSVVPVIGGKARVGILGVPPGAYTLRVLYLDGQLVQQTMTVPVVTTADTATIVKTGGTGVGGGGGGGGMMLPPNPTFTAHIYPKLQKASLGGLGCANCHTLGGQAALLRYDLLATDVHAALLARTGPGGALAINLTLGSEATSLFLTNPLYEPPGGIIDPHPNATFADINDNNYKLFLRWLTQGAPL